MTFTQAKAAVHIGRALGEVCVTAVMLCGNVSVVAAEAKKQLNSLDPATRKLAKRGVTQVFNKYETIIAQEADHVRSLKSA